MQDFEFRCPIFAISSRLDDASDTVTSYIDPFKDLAPLSDEDKTVCGGTTFSWTFCACDFYKPWRKMNPSPMVGARVEQEPSSLLIL